MLHIMYIIHCPLLAPDREWETLIGWPGQGARPYMGMRPCMR